MYKLAILGCENSHANAFLDAVLNRRLVDDVEFVGIYSDDRAAAEKLSAQFGVPVADAYDQFVGKVDGLLITARHGDNHYPYAKPYLDDGIPMFIDKPITCTEEDARAFRNALAERGVPVSGGSICVLDKHVQRLKKAVQYGEYGRVLGGYLRAPIKLGSPYGGFYFYCQHLVQVMTEIFGCWPASVRAVQKNDTVTCLVHYADYDVTLAFVDENNLYYACVSFDNDVVGSKFDFEGCSDMEFMKYHALLDQSNKGEDYEEFFAPVYIFNAILRALESGAEEPIHRA